VLAAQTIKQRTSKQRITKTEELGLEKLKGDDSVQERFDTINKINCDLNILLQIN